MASFGASKAGGNGPRARARTEAEERAREAVRVFRSMIPTLNAYARAVTKNPRVTIQITMNNGSSDKDTIYFQPPIELGDKTPHDLPNCHKRNIEGFQVCLACRIRERTMAVIYHEMLGHISQGTFMPYTEQDVINMMRLAVPLWGSTVLAHRNRATAAVIDLERRNRRAGDGKGQDFMNLLNCAHPWLPKIWNAIEDARVNEKMFRARPGVRAMYDAMLAQIEAEGIPEPGTGNKVLWRDSADEFQLVVGLSLKLGGYDISEMFRWNVLAVLDDIELNAVLDRFSYDQTARDSFELSFAVVYRLNQLGFMRLPEIEDPAENPKVPPPPPEPQPEEQPDEPTAEEEDESLAPLPSGTDGDPGGDEKPGSEPDSGDQPGDDLSVEPEGLGDSKLGSDSEAEGTGEGDDTGSGGEQSDEPGADDLESDDRGAEDQDESDGPASHADSGKARDDEDGSGRGDSSSGVPDREGSDDADSDASPERGEVADGPAGDTESGGSDSADETSSEPASGGEREDHEVDDEAGQPADTEDELRPDGGDAGDSSDRDGVDHQPPELPDVSEEASGPESDVLRDGGDNDREINDSGAAGEPIEIDISLDPNESTSFGNPDDVNVELGEMLDPDTRTQAERDIEEEAMMIAVEQGDWFETPARGVSGVRVHVPGDRDFYCGMSRDAIRRKENAVVVTPNDLRQPTMQMRLIFEANRRAKMQRHLKSGKINTKVLGKRAPLHDPRLFQRKRLPGKIDYELFIGMDLSYSTEGRNLMIEKNAIYAQAEMANSLSIPFSIFGHSGMVSDDNLHIYRIKAGTDKWDDDAKRRLMNMNAISANLDGHALEFLRKAADRSSATHKIILYYSDGKMPAENGPEERVVLKREIEYCQQRGHTLIGVGIRTDSPKEHGLDTVQLDDMSDLPKVIAFLGKYLAKVNAI